MFDLLLKNATLADGQTGIDLAIERGRIKRRQAGLACPAAKTIDLHGKLLSPGFVDSHVHLDIALMSDGDRPGRPAPFLSPVELNDATENGRKALTREIIEQRAGQSIEMASRHGVTAIRAQCHIDQEIGLKHIEALLNVREKYRDRVSLQIVTFPQHGLLGQPEMRALLHEAFRRGADVMGGSCTLDPRVASVADAKTYIDAALELAIEAGVDFDLHADLGIPERVAHDDLEVVHLARRTIECGYQGRVTAGHVCALDSAEPEVAASAIELIREANISVISQPDMFRLGRTDRRGVRRGLTRVKQLLAAGVNVAFASNNVRDAYRPLGNFDLLEEGLVLAYGAHMDSVSELETLLRMCTVHAARALRLDRYGLNEGDQADLVVLDAPSPSAALARQAEKLLVFKNGALVAANSRKSELYGLDLQPLKTGCSEAEDPVG
jgi:cytosine deaminase